MDNWDPLAWTTAVNTAASAIAAQLSDAELNLAAAVLTQLGDTLATIAVLRANRTDYETASADKTTGQDTD